MLWTLCAALVANSAPAAQPPARPVPQRQASATVRIVRGAPVRFGRSDARPEESISRSGTVREADGSIRPATLVEFY